MIQDYVKNSEALKEYASLCATPEGKKLYDETLKCVRMNFPQYVVELEGLAHGAEVPFDKVRFSRPRTLIAKFLRDEQKLVHR